MTDAAEVSAADGPHAPHASHASHVLDTRAPHGAQPAASLLPQALRLPRVHALALRHAVLLFAFAVVIRLPSLLHPQAIDDESVYAVVAHEILDGGLPYVHAIERKPPLLFWAYAAVFELAGKGNWLALHTAALLWLLLTMAGVYILVRRLFDARAAALAAAFCALYSSWATWKNLAANGELLMNLPIVWAAVLVFHRDPRATRVRPELLAAGALFAMAFLFKQPAAIAALPFGVYLLLPSYRKSRDLGWLASLWHAGLLFAGFAATLAVVALRLASQGILDEAYYWTLTDHDVPHIFVSRGIAHTLAFTAACLPLLLGAVSAVRDRTLWSGKSAERTALIALALVSAFGAAAAGRFYPHYYIQLVPPLSLLAAPAYAAAFVRAPPHGPRLPSARVLQGWLGLTLLVFAMMHWHTLLSRRADSDTARYLRAHASNPSTAAADRLFVWGHWTQLYLQSGLRPASRYITTFPLTGYIFGAPVLDVDTRHRILPGAWDNLRRDLRAHPPRFIVDTQHGPKARYPAAEFPWLTHLLTRDYRPVFRSHDNVVYRRLR